MSISSALFAEAKQYIPGGVNSPVRAFHSVGGTPPFIQSAQGAYLIDEDERRYIDYVGSWGAAILGHSHPAVVKAVQEAAELGLSYGAPTVAEIRLARKITQHMPSLESIRLVSSGTEAAMSAIRLARAATGRDKILKFEGCYHGHSDSLLVKAGSGGLTLGVPSSPGVPASLAQHTLTATYNDLDSVAQWFEKVGHDIAAVIVEPVAGNMNCILPVEGFLKGLRSLCDHYQTVLILDEVMTGFRVGLGGAQQHFGVTPDLTVLGKVIGGGLPLAAFGGKRTLMEQMAPVGPVYQAGTLSGNPIAVAAGLATLSEVERPGFYEALTAKTQQFMEGLVTRAHAVGIPFSVNYLGGLFGFFFTSDQPVRYLSQVTQSDLPAFKRFFTQMLQKGIYLAPSAYEAGFLSIAHGEEEIQLSLNAAEEVFAGEC